MPTSLCRLAAAQKCYFDLSYPSLNICICIIRLQTSRISSLSSLTEHFRPNVTGRHGWNVHMLVRCSKVLPKVKLHLISTPLCVV